MLPLWGVSFIILFGIVAMSFDLGRIGITRSELQSFADNVALAAAGELDGQDDAITRATNAAEQLIADSHTFGTNDSVLSGSGDFTLRFLSALPADDTLPVSAFTQDPAAAIYAHVEVNNDSIPLTFAAAFSALTGQAGPDNTAGATAIAGFTQYACDVSTMMFCIPPGFDPSEEAGNMIQLRTGSGESGQWGPGNFGFLSPPASATAADPSGNCSSFSESAQEWCVLAAQSPVSTCFDQRGVDTNPGQTVGRMAAALNTRFGIYEGVLNSYRDFPAFGPAPNVISGMEVYTQGGGKTPQCHTTQADPGDPEYTVPLPVDDCFNSGGCPRGRFGNGQFAAGYNEYVSTNYGTAPAWFPAYPTTRYQMYLSEIANSTNGAIAEMAGKQENGAAMCNATNRSDDPERRVIVAAGIDCGRYDVRGNATGIPVDSWVKVFLIKPADTVTKDVFVEVISGAQGNGTSGILHDVIQLYR
ncbi:Tad domain-containing protein [Shimia biformata]|uniref:Tad domain-containing protein n=1 Tax=Shimia biformata TaxID=1294299 RepID=UPI0023B330C3|nr:Tad domain-containing protein [Shimia biformata]